MTFLQPLLLWALPLALAPVVIHLLNRMRHKPKRWAAMAFLMKANRASTRQARLREWLILLCRTLALVALALVLCRPVAGGWFGGLFGGAPDVVMILLDRSASMEMRRAPGEPTRRELALRAIMDAGAVYGGRTRFVLVESAGREPHEVAALAALGSLSATGPTDGAADLPAMLDQAAGWLERQKPGAAELWIASDLQTSNWDPAGSRWAGLDRRLLALPGHARVRILSFTAAPALNRALTLQTLSRVRHGSSEVLQVGLELRSSEAEAGTIPLRIESGDDRAEVEVALEGNTTRWTKSFPIDATGRWASCRLVLPADANARDDAVYFVVPPPVQLRAALVATDEAVRKTLSLAIAPGPKVGVVCDVIGDPATAEWDRDALVVWQSPLPDGATADRLTQYLQAGGVVVFLPPGEKGDATFAGRTWAEVTPSETGWKIGQWEEQDGPLANTEDGAQLPLASLAMMRRQLCTGEKNAGALFADGAPFLLRDAIGRGQAIWLTSLPMPAWSNLADGPVLVPALQRLLQQGARRLGRGSQVEVGADFTGEAAGLDPRVNAGIYHDGDRLVAVNRPAREDEAGTLTAAQVRPLFAGIPVEWWEEKGSPRPVQSEIWRGLLAAMLVFLTLEALLTLPRRATPASARSGTSGMETFA